MTTIINGSSPSITFSDGSAQTSATQPFKNRIINGAMTIDQRNAGASVTVNVFSRVYGVDRWFGFGEASDGVFTIQQDTVVPVGFNNSLKVTTTTADASVGASQYYILGQSIEGFNFADLNWGSANAKTVTLSFWVRSSLTGQFGGSLMNGASNRSYPYTYTISAANTWEQKSVTIAGDTTGTWVGATNGIGANVWFDLGCGSSNIGTAGVWAGAGYYGATGDTKLISTNGATFYITGVQLEVGSTATSFDYRPYGTELALCQRYFWKPTNEGYGLAVSVYSAAGRLTNPVPMRAAATISSASFATSGGPAGTVTSTRQTPYGQTLYNGSGNWSVTDIIDVSGQISAEL